MNTVTRKTVFASALITLCTLAATGKVYAQEAALVYASNVTATHSLNNIDAQVTPGKLARDYSRALIAEMDVRLSLENTDTVETLHIKDDFNTSILEDLDVRLKQEILSLTASATD